ncbi:MAG: hypothetical protein OXL38_03120 [Gammaproteobacteria bacterium]|nr:hypothetical protein [Gammaproteobacteria bacterium]
MGSREVSGALDWIDTLPTPSGSPGDEHQGVSLVKIAARLGDEWAAWKQNQPSH